MTHDDEDDAPEFTDEVMARARPAREVLPEEVLNAFRRGKGRPKLATPKVAISVRVDSDVLERLRASGPGWQTRVNDFIRAGLEADLAASASPRR